MTNVPVARLLFALAIAAAASATSPGDALGVDRNAGAGDAAPVRDAARSAPAVPVADSVPGAELAGDWMGELVVGPTTLRLVLTVEVADEGALEATLNSVDQDAIVPVSSIALEDGVLRLRMAAIGASFEGVVSAEGDAIEGDWSQSGRELPLTFQRRSEP